MDSDADPMDNGNKSSSESKMDKSVANEEKVINLPPWHWLNVEDEDEDEEKVSRSYTPLSFYMDPTVSHPGPLRKNCIPLSFYTTVLVYHPAPDLTSESKMDIFVENEEKVSNPLLSYLDSAFPFPGPLRKNYIPLSSYTMGQSKVRFRSQSSESKSVAKVCFGSQSSESKSVSKVSTAGLKDIFMVNEEKVNNPLLFYMHPTVSFPPFLLRKNYIPGLMDKGQSSKLKVSRNSIPDIVAFSILSKLSIKSLKRFQSVRKSWSILFDNSHFMIMYRKHFLSRHASDHHYHTFILTNYPERPVTPDHHYHTELHLLENRIKLNLPPTYQQTGVRICILGNTSVNGVFCFGQNYLSIHKVQYVVWNPATEEFLVIPPSLNEVKPHYPQNGLHLEYEFHGFGYDQVRDDFKIIQHVSLLFGDFHVCSGSYFEIYSLKSNSWRMIDMEFDLDWNFQSSFTGSEVYVDGACHWLVTKFINYEDPEMSLTLLSFDLTDELFLTTPIGEEPYSPYTFGRCLTVLNGSIALISNYHDDIVFHISILDELGVSESWTKLYTYGPSPSIIWPPIAFGKTGYMFFTNEDNKLAYVDLSTQIIEEVDITGGKSSYFFVGLYKESLLPIRGPSN